jgi:hypothetical protein
LSAGLLDNTLVTAINAELGRLVSPFEDVDITTLGLAVASGHPTNPWIRSSDVLGELSQVSHIEARQILQAQELSQFGSNLVCTRQTKI